MTIPAEEWLAWRDTDMVRFLAKNIQVLRDVRARERNVVPNSMDLTFYKASSKDGFIEAMQRVLDILNDDFPPTYSEE